MNLEDEIKNLGYAFRDLTYHSDGRYSCRLGGTYLNELRIKRIPSEFWADTPIDAVIAAKYALDLAQKETERDY